MANAVAGTAADAEPYDLHYGVLNGLKGWFATCACGMSHRVNGGPTHPTRLVISQMEKHGWLIKKNKPPVCTNCQEPKVAKPSPQIGPDPKLARKIYAALDEHFDDVKRVYRAGCSDAWVAKFLDVSIDIVANIRVAAYGELAVDPAITKLQEDIDLVKMEMEDAFEIQRKDMDSAHTTIRNTFNAKIAELQSRLPAKPKVAI